MDNTTMTLVRYAQNDSANLYTMSRTMRAESDGCTGRLAAHYSRMACDTQNMAARDAAIARRLLGIDE